MVNFDRIEAGDGRYIKAWRKGVYFEQEAIQQLIAAARLSIVGPYVAAMPDCHKGFGSTVGSVIPTRGAIIPSSIGVDIGCGMMYERLDIHRDDLPADLGELRAELEAAIPNGGPGEHGSWPEQVPAKIRSEWMRNFNDQYSNLVDMYPDVESKFAMRQLGTLGTGNHFVELTTESEEGKVGILLHSGSRGLGNRIGSHFTRLAKQICAGQNLGDPDLAYLTEGTEVFDDYIAAMRLAQYYAWMSRELMMSAAFNVLAKFSKSELFNSYPGTVSIHHHHNYAAQETHYGEKLWITRKGAVHAGLGALGIIPGSMGAKTYVVRGLGSPDSFESCSHGAGRTMSRTAAKKAFTVEQHVAATAGVECDKTADTLDETPGAYKPIQDVIAAQSDLVVPVFTMKQFLCIKGLGERQHGKKL
jgi:tRNA-splicing ligase RtcB